MMRSSGWMESRRGWMRAMAGGAAALWGLGRGADRSEAACCYFAAKNSDVDQPAQKAFITWEPNEKRESFTVQPKFAGNAKDFGMVIPTPARPKLDEMPRDFFKMLAVFTILEPMPLDKYKAFSLFAKSSSAANAGAGPPRRGVVVLEQGVVGSLDYKIVKASDAKDLYDWLDEHQYQYAGDEKTLDFYIRKEWFFTVMKIDPTQMKRRDDGSYSGEVTPTRFTFASTELVYPLRITSISVRDKTEALFYVQAPKKMDLKDSFSYQFTWQSMWAQAMGFAVKRTEDEQAWLTYLEPWLKQFAERIQTLRGDRVEPATLEWAKRIGTKELGILDGTVRYNRDAPESDVKQLKILRGHLREGQTLTKFRKVFHPREMTDDLVLVPAMVGEREDRTAYYEILPTSPP